MTLATAAPAVISAEELIAVDDEFAKFGFSASADISQGTCKVEMHLKLPDIADKIDVLKQAKLLNEDFTREKARLQPLLTTAAIAIQLDAATVRYTYTKYVAADRCFFTQTMIMRDDYGKDVDVDVLSYYFDRSIYNAINWENFDPSRIDRVAKRFSFDPAMAIRMQSELLTNNQR